MLHHKVQGQGTSVISVSVVHVGELEWIHIGVGDRFQMRKNCQSLLYIHQRFYLGLRPLRNYGRCLRTQRNSVLMKRGAK